MKITHGMLAIGALAALPVVGIGPGIALAGIATTAAPSVVSMPANPTAHQPGPAYGSGSGEEPEPSDEADQPGQPDQPGTHDGAGPEGGPGGHADPPGSMGHQTGPQQG